MLPKLGKIASESKGTARLICFFAFTLKTFRREINEYDISSSVIIVIIKTISIIAVVVVASALWWRDY